MIVPKKMELWIDFKIYFQILHTLGLSELNTKISRPMKPVCLVITMTAGKRFSFPI